MKLSLDRQDLDIGINLAVGGIEGLTAIRRFISATPFTTSFTALWTMPAAQVRTAQAAAVRYGISSSSANDTAAGTGARTVRLTYLDASYVEKTEDITLNGTTKVQTVATDILRCQSLRVLTAGSGGVNAGAIYAYDTSDTVTAGVPDTATKRFGVIVAGENTSNMGLFCVPAGHTYLITRINLQQYDTAARYMRFRFGLKGPTDAVFVYTPFAALSTAADNGKDSWLRIPWAIPEKTDFVIEAIASAAGSTVVGEVDAIDIPSTL